MDIATIKKELFHLSSPGDFNVLAMEIFRYQYENNDVYRRFTDALVDDVKDIDCVEHIPFLPVSFFRTHRVFCGGADAAMVFRSSGTGGEGASRHYVADLALYEQSFHTAFEHFYGPVSDYCILALLPSYLERDNSSLVYMAGKLIQLSDHPHSGFYLNETELLLSTLHTLKTTGDRVLLLGVSFALLDLVERYPLHYPGLVVMETGGMKGRRHEMVRDELHKKLCRGFGVKKIHSEYGMTELLSQSYSEGGGMFRTPPWMRVLTRDVHDPLSRVAAGRSGGINVIDLANAESCSFIATQDLGRVHADGRFEVLGRFDHSDVRGCNLLVE